MFRVLPRAALIVVVAMGVWMAGCQRAEPPAEPGPASTLLSEDLQNAWNRESSKLMEMAEDFPEDKYDYRPNPKVRTFGDQLLHVAGANYFLVHAARGQEGEPRRLAHEDYRTKAAIVEALRESFAEVSKAIQEMDDARLQEQVKHPFADRQVTRYGLFLSVVTNAAEHYGQLVVYYRNNGMVPPASRR